LGVHNQQVVVGQSAKVNEEVKKIIKATIEEPQDKKEVEDKKGVEKKNERIDKDLAMALVDDLQETKN